MVPERPITVPEGPGTIPEGPGSFRKVLEGSGQYHLLRPLCLGGKPPGPALAGQEVGAHQGGGVLLQVGFPNPPWSRRLPPKGSGVHLGLLLRRWRTRGLATYK